MSYSYTTTESTTFTVTYAKHIAIKVGTDLKRMQRFYGTPDDKQIVDYERELVALMMGNYLDKIEYGFMTVSRAWRLALKYQARYGGVLIADDDPGKIPLGIDVSGCHFHSFFIGTQRWETLSGYDRERVYEKAGVSLRRVAGTEPFGRWSADRTYSSGGRGVERSSLRRYSK